MLTFRFFGADGVMTVPEKLTTGMLGKQVKLEFSSEWGDLTKTAVFSAGDVSIAVHGVGEIVTIPAEVLLVPMQRLYIGIYGELSDGTLIIPTIYARGPRIERGADPYGAVAGDPPMPKWKELEGRIEQLEDSGGTMDHSQLSNRYAADQHPIEAITGLRVILDKVNEGSGGGGDYVLPVGGEKLGGVKNGGNVVINADGTMTAPETGNPTDEQIGSAVAAYLDEHPEATTTVQDGSITPAKFSKSTAERLECNLYAIGKRIISNEYSKIVLMGDSITDGYGGSDYNGSQTGELSTNTVGYCWANVFKKYIEDKHGVPVENKGMYGTMAAAQVAKAKTYLSGDELVIWLTGTNNRISADSYGDYVSNMGQYINDLQSRCADLVVMSCVPAVESNEKARYVTSAEICEVLIAETAGKAFFVDMRKGFARYCEIFGYTIDSVMADGLHPNNTGYWIMFRLLCDNIGIPISTFVNYKYGAEWWGNHGGDTTEKTLTSISATYSGGSVPTGTAVSELTGIVVTAHYSDGTSETVTGYTLSGTISEGSNNVVVSYGGKTTTFLVTGVTESGSEYVSVFPDHVDKCLSPMTETNNFAVSAEIPVGTISKVKISSKINGVYRLYFATKGDDNAYTVTQVEELNVSIGINTIETNIVIAQPCYLIVTGEGARFFFEDGLPDYLPMKHLSNRENTPVLVGDTFTESSETKGCYIGVWLGMKK